MTRKKLTKSEMDRETTYILCPDSSCKLFFYEGQLPCEHNGCPMKDKMHKVIKCFCGELVVLPWDHFMICRVDHNCANGRTASMFQRMSGKYRLIYELPK